jgi:WD40 repeat protein
MTDVPHFKLARVYDDGTSEPAEIVPLLEIPQDTDMGRRGFLGMGAVFGAGIAATGAIATMPDPAEAAGKKKKKTSSKKKKKKPGPLAAHIGIVRAIDLATNGKSIATGGDDKRVKIWSMPDGKLIHTLKGHGQRVTAVAVSASGAFVVSAANERVTRIWRITEKAAKSQSTSVQKHLKSSSVVVAPDESYALAGLTNGQIKVFELPGGKTRTTLKGHSGSVRAFRFSADGTILMSWSASSVRLWSMPEGRLLRAFDVNKSDPIRAAEMTLDASHLAVATLKGSATVPALSGLMPLLDKVPYAAPTETQNRRLNVTPARGGFSNVLSLTSSAESDWFAAGTTVKTVRVWTPEPDEKKKILRKHTKPVTALAPTPDGKLLLSGSRDKSVILWTMPNGKFEATLKGHPSSVRDIAVTPDSRYAAVSSANTVVIWDLEKRKIHTHLFDPAATGKDTEAQSYNIFDKSTGQWITYTLPCGSPIPAGAVCTCNCVPGRHYVAAPKRRGRPTYRRGGTYCSCNKVCVCIPVCQAHHVLDARPAVRTIAEEILCVMGDEEFEYMDWAAASVPAIVADRIRTIMQQIEDGRTPDPAHWPDVQTCEALMEDSEPVVALMAAQMLDLRCDCGIPLAAATQKRMGALLDTAPSLYWRNRA